MYSNQKDQINLEEVYKNIHSEINEAQVPDASFGNAVAFLGMIALPVAMEFVMNRYKGFIRNKNIKGLTDTIVSTIKNDSELQNKIESLKKEADASKSEEYTTAIKQLLSKSIKYNETFSNEVQNVYEDKIIKEILNLLPNNFSGKTNDQITKEVQRNINVSNAEQQNQQRKRMGLPSVRPMRL
jgi:hypothetical protein